MISISDLKTGSRRALAKCITLVESELPQHRIEVTKIIESLLPCDKKALKIGISGSPGVGKSSFIESLGKLIVGDEKKLCILAVDPSSPLTKGSILGDKTRMQDLAKDNRVFIRPTPSRGFLGGIARSTRETTFLAEAAGYDVIIIETVGVGQSEIEVASMVDIFLTLHLPNSGDELQGIKKGILEVADVIAITKCDGTFNHTGNIAKKQIETAIALSHGHRKKVEVFCTSAISGSGLLEIWRHLIKLYTSKESSGELDRVRKEQNLHWLEVEVTTTIINYLKNLKAVRSEIEAGKKQLNLGKTLPSLIAARLRQKLEGIFDDKIRSDASIDG